MKLRFLVAIIEFIDIYPTLAELAGLKNVPDYFEGRSFSKVLKIHLFHSTDQSVQ